MKQNQKKLMNHLKLNLTYIVSYEVDIDNVAVYIHADDRIQGAFDEFDETE